VVNQPADVDGQIAGSEPGADRHLVVAHAAKSDLGRFDEPDGGPRKDDPRYSCTIEVRPT